MLCNGPGTQGDEGDKETKEAKETKETEGILFWIFCWQFFLFMFLSFSYFRSPEFCLLSGVGWGGAILRDLSKS